MRLTPMRKAQTGSTPPPFENCGRGICRAALTAEDDGGAPEHLTKIFLGAVLGDFHFREIIGLSPRTETAEIEAHVRVAVRIFLQGLGRRLTGANDDSGAPTS